MRLLHHAAKSHNMSDQEVLLYINMFPLPLVTLWLTSSSVCSQGKSLKRNTSYLSLVLTLIILLFLFFLIFSSRHLKAQHYHFILLLILHSASFLSLLNCLN